MPTGRIHNIVFIFWELPQNLAGLFLMIITGRKILKKEIIHYRIFLRVPGFSVSLGHFIFWSNDDRSSVKTNSAIKAHEYGHAIQSMIFGPLYVIVIGISSGTRKLYGSWYFSRHKSSWKSYYDGFPENWADRLGELYFHPKEI